MFLQFKLYYRCYDLKRNSGLNFSLYLRDNFFKVPGPSKSETFLFEFDVVLNYFISNCILSNANRAQSYTRLNVLYRRIQNLTVEKWSVIFSSQIWLLWSITLHYGCQMLLQLLLKACSSCSENTICVLAIKKHIEQMSFMDVAA